MESSPFYIRLFLGLHLDSELKFYVRDQSAIEYHFDTRFPITIIEHEQKKYLGCYMESEVALNEIVERQRELEYQFSASFVKVNFESKHFIIIPILYINFKEDKPYG